MPEDVFRWVVAIAVGLACVGFAIQVSMLFALFRIVQRVRDKFIPLADRAEPILDKTRKILDENHPRITQIAVDAVEVAKTAREQSHRLGDLIQDAGERAKARMAQIDEAVDEAVVQVEQAGGAVKTAMIKPAREVAGVISGVKAAVVTFAQGGRRSSVDHATQDEEMFI